MRETSSTNIRAKNWMRDIEIQTKTYVLRLKIYKVMYTFSQDGTLLL